MGIDKRFPEAAKTGFEIDLVSFTSFFDDYCLASSSCSQACLARKVDTKHFNA